jgi:transposase
MMTSLLTEVEKEKIKFLYESGNTTEQIAKIYNVTAPTIRNFMKKHGIRIRKPRNFLTKEQKEQISSLHDSGITQKQIAKIFNVSTSCIHNNLNKPKKEKEVAQSNTIIDIKNTGYNPIQLTKKRTQINDELNLYIPEKWKR